MPSQKTFVLKGEDKPDPAKESTTLKDKSNSAGSRPQSDGKFELQSSNYFSKLAFAKGFQVINNKNYKLRNQDGARYNTELLQKEFNSVKKMGRALYNVYKTEYLLIGLYKLGWTVFTWLGAYYLLKRILQFLGSTNADFVEGQVLAVMFFLAGFLSSIAIHQQYTECNLVGVKVKAAVMGLIYRKSLRLSRVKGGAGQVINLMTSDIDRLNDFVCNFHFLWSAFVEVSLIVVLSFIEIGYSALPALGWIMIFLPIQMYLGKLTDKLGIEQANQTTQRVHMMSEVLTAIKLIKFYAWEMPFATRIAEIRKKEMDMIYKGLLTKVVNYAVVFAIPVLVALSCLSMYVAVGNPLTAAVSFTVLSVFNTLRYPFFMLPMAVKSYVGCMAALIRIDNFLAGEEIAKVPTTIDTSKDIILEIEDSDFKWDGTVGKEPTIRNVSLKIKRGSKVGIVGDVGSGKSSIIAAILGQIRQHRGNSPKIYGTTAYMSQEAWLLNMTLRQNILFGKEMNAEKYKEVIRVSGLQRDLTLLVAGDQTEIAERGVNLSGGQRQRVSLARSVYYDSDIVIMDDPLSAVDQHVGRHIFEECFMKHLKNKTLIVAINQLQYLSELDHIVFVNNGTIIAQGTYGDLMANNEKFHDMVSAHVADGNYEVEDDFAGEVGNDKDFEVAEVASPVNVESSVMELPKRDYLESNGLSVVSRNQLSVQRNFNEHTIRSLIDLQNRTSIPGLRNHDVAAVIERNSLSQHHAPSSPLQKIVAEEIKLDDAAQLEKGKLVVEDESTKTAGFNDFLNYARVGVGIGPTLMTMAFFSVVHGVRIGGDYWLRLWVPRVGNFPDVVYIGVYGVFTALFAGGALLRGYIFARVTTSKARKLHDKLFDAAIHAPMAFYDTTPIARVLACFSKHQRHVDDTMLDAGMQALQYFPLGLGAFLLSAILIPWNWAPCITIAFFGYILLNKTNKADIETKSLEAVSKPPIYSHLTATLEGLISIRCYQAEDRFDSMNLEKIDNNHANLMAMQLVKSLQAFYFDVLSSFILYFSALLLVIRAGEPQIASVAGLALSNALQMLVFVQWTVKQWGEVETQMSSVGQLVFYGNIAPEAPFEIEATKPLPNWPENGLVKFRNVELKYQKFGVSVLKNINLTIYPREKIGIVGRTGSGKSTLLISLLRITEPCNGVITIDGLDVSTIGLHELRNKIAIIPQEPVMFVGTIRSNLDPFNRCTDEEIWKALDSVFLGEKLRQTELKLDTEVTENGKSVSQGQRQLICIARAILSKATVLVLDEATASLDPQTDLMIQEAIQKNFGNLTMLTIAHRLNTIIESDRVLVMDAGCVKEFDEPFKLLQNKDGIFFSLVEQTGELAAKKLFDIAKESHDKRVAAGYEFPKPEIEDDQAPMKVEDIAKGAFK